MGMVAVRYTGINDDTSQPGPEGDLVVARHAESPGALRRLSGAPERALRS